MTETYHNEALRKQRIVDKKHEAIARIKYGEVRTIPLCLYDARKFFLQINIHLISKYELILVTCSN